jgi:hypothetical protein
VDEKTFDRITQRLSSDASRRWLLGGLLGGASALAGAVLLGGDDSAEAKRGGNGKGRGKGKGNGKKNGHNKGKRRKNKDKGGDNGQGQTKVVICHKGQTLEVAEPAVQAHLNHGDTVGACTTSPPSCSPSQTNCNGVCVDLTSDEANCGACGRACAAGDVCNNGLACQPATCLPVTGTAGNVSLADNGQLTATTEQAAEFGNLIMAVPDGTTFGKLATIESGFDFATGTCAAGSPRFVVFLDNGRCPYAAFPPGGDCEDGQGSTGDLTQNNDPFVWNDDLCGGSGLGTNTYDEVLALYQNEPVDRIVVVVDGSGGEQTVTLDPCVTVTQS